MMRILDDPVVEAYNAAQAATREARIDALATLVAVIRATEGAAERITAGGYLYPRAAWRDATSGDIDEPAPLIETLCEWCLSADQADLLTPDLGYAVSVAMEVCQ